MFENNTIPKQVMTIINILQLNLTLTASKIHVIVMSCYKTVNKSKRANLLACSFTLPTITRWRHMHTTTPLLPIPFKTNVICNTMYFHTPQDPNCQNTVTVIVFLFGSTIFSICTAEALLFNLLQDGTEI